MQTIKEKEKMLKNSISNIFFNNWNFKNSSTIIFNTKFYENLFDPQSRHKINQYFSKNSKKILTIKDLKELNEILKIFNIPLNYTYSNKELISKINKKILILFEELDQQELNTFFNLWNDKNNKLLISENFYFKFFRNRFQKLAENSKTFLEIKEQYKNTLQILSSKFNKKELSLKEFEKSFIWFLNINKVFFSFSEYSLDEEMEKKMICKNLRIKENETEFKNLINQIYKNLSTEKIRDEFFLVFCLLESNIFSPQELIEFLSLLFENKNFADEHSKKRIVNFIVFNLIKAYPNRQEYIKKIISLSKEVINIITNYINELKNAKKGGYSSNYDESLIAEIESCLENN